MTEVLRQNNSVFYNLHGYQETAMNRNLIERKKEPDSELDLWEVIDDQGKEYEIVMNGVFIMASYNQLSSERLLELPMEKIRSRDTLRILVGGLGMGFTVKAACSFASIVHIDVVEVEPVIVEWNITYLKKLHQNCLENKKVHIIIDDFYDYVRKGQNKYDIICMDIDNGPKLLTRESNQRVYQIDFLKRIKGRIKERGIFAVWLYDMDPDIIGEIGKVFPNYLVDEVMEEVNDRKEPYYICSFFRE